MDLKIEEQNQEIKALEDNAAKPIEERKEKKKEQSIKDNSSKSGKKEDTNFISFKTTKNKENKNKKEKDVKSYGTNYLHETPGGETPNGITPDLNSQMKVSKEELIKISTEPVANYYTIIKDLGHGSYGQVKKADTACRKP